MRQQDEESTALAAVAFESEDTKKKKSAGGVLMALLKKDSRVTPQMRKKIFKAHTERKRQKRFTASMLMGLTLDNTN